jgi:hypothetical protein
MSKPKPKATNLIIGDFLTQGDLSVRRVRKAAKKSCEKLLCIGVDKRGRPYYASSFADAHQMLWMIERFKAKLLSGKFS